MYFSFFRSEAFKTEKIRDAVGIDGIRLVLIEIALEEVDGLGVHDDNFQGQGFELRVFRKEGGGVEAVHGCGFHACDDSKVSSFLCKSQNVGLRIEAPFRSLGSVHSLRMVSSLSRTHTSSFSELTSIPTYNFMVRISFRKNLERLGS